MAESAVLKRRSLYRVRLLGSIRSDELLPAAELRRRLNWGRKAYTKALSDGLKTIRYGRCDYCLGEDVLAFFVAQSGRQSGTGAPDSASKTANVRPDVAGAAGEGGAGL
jgi:hypothetical protein